MIVGGEAPPERTTDVRLVALTGAAIVAVVALFFVAIHAAGRAARH